MIINFNLHCYHCLLLFLPFVEFPVNIVAPFAFLQLSVVGIGVMTPVGRPLGDTLLITLANVYSVPIPFAGGNGAPMGTVMTMPFMTLDDVSNGIAPGGVIRLAPLV